MMNRRWTSSGCRTLWALYSAAFISLPGDASCSVGNVAGYPSGASSLRLLLVLLVLLLCGLGVGLLRIESTSIFPSLPPRFLVAQSLPRYQIEIAQDGFSDSIKQSEQTSELSTDSLLAVTLRPLDRVLGPVAIRCYLRRGEALRPWDVQPLRTPAGTFHLRGPVAEFKDLFPGYTELIFVIGSPRVIFTRQLDERLADSLRLPEGVQALRARVHIRPRE